MEDSIAWINIITTQELKYSERILDLELKGQRNRSVGSPGTTATTPALNLLLKKQASSQPRCGRDSGEVDERVAHRRRVDDCAGARIDA